MSTAQELVARNIKRFRVERGLSMAELARRAGLAKQTLSTLEAGGGNPTVDTLGLLAEALGTPVRRLLTEWGTSVFVQRKQDAQWATDGVGHERLMSEIYGSGYIRTLVVQLERGRDRGVPLEGLSRGVLHHLYVLAGRVRVGPVGDPVDAGVGDFVRYPADVEHVLRPLSEKASVLIVSSEPQLRQFRESR